METKTNSIELLQEKSNFGTDVILFNEVKYTEFTKYNLIPLLEEFYRRKIVTMFTMRKLEDGTIYTHGFKDTKGLLKEVQSKNTIYIELKSCGDLINKINEVEKFCAKYLLLS